MDIKAVVFDIGNVLLEWDPVRFYDSVHGPERSAALFAAVDLHGMNADVDLGAPFRDTVYALAEKHPDWAPEIRDWHDRWIDMASPDIPRSVRLLRALRAKGVPTVALSNFGVDSLALAETHYPWLVEFDHRFISGHLRLAKPDAAIYAAVEETLDLPGTALLFADDREENIRAAEARGWHGHLFTTPDRWAARLVAEGLLTEDEAA